MQKIQPQAAPRLRKPRYYGVALCYAAVSVVVTTYGLFKFDEITDVISRYGIGGGTGGLAAAALVAGAGVFSLPYLLRIQVSPLMRIVSFVAALALPFGWLLGAWCLELYGDNMHALVAMLAAHVSILLALVSAWSIGLPLRPLKKHR